MVPAAFVQQQSVEPIGNVVGLDPRGEIATVAPGSLVAEARHRQASCRGPRVPMSVKRGTVIA